MIRLLRSTRIEQEEIRAWAYDRDPRPPENADPNAWDLMITEWFAYDPLYVELALDEACPKREVFLSLLRQLLRRRCARTRWLNRESTDLLLGIPPSRWTGHSKGRGRKEKSPSPTRSIKRTKWRHVGMLRSYSSCCAHAPPVISS